MKLSIITINYNNRDGLRRTIDSVLCQTWHEFEWIIVDGGSTDGSRELIEDTASRLATMDSLPVSTPWRVERFSLLGFSAKEWDNGIHQQPSLGINGDEETLSLNKKNQEKIFRWCSEKDNGIYNAMNKGIVMAQGEYCLFLNSGDCLYDSNVLTKVDISQRDADVVYGAVYVTGQNSRLWNVRQKDLNLYRFYAYTIPHQGSFIKTNLFYKYGLYDESLRIVSDWKFFLQAIPLGQAVVEKIPLLISICDGMGISRRQVEARISERELVIKETLPPMVVEDLLWAQSVREIRQNRFFSFCYSLLYRVSALWREINKKSQIKDVNRIEY